MVEELYDKEITRLTSEFSAQEDFSYEALISIGDIMNVQRVSLWHFDSKGGLIECQTLLDKDSGVLIEVAELREVDFPNYFLALKKGKSIVADDAQSDPRTCEFTDLYLVPNQITSVLDAPIFSNGKLSGIICCEHCGSKRHWEKYEESFVYNIASLIQLSH